MSEKENDFTQESKLSNVYQEVTDEARCDTEDANTKEGNRCWLIGNLLFFLYGRTKRKTIRSFIRYLILKLEGGQLFSLTIRRIFSVYHKVDIGLYSEGGCFILHNFPPMTKIGRYCSIADTARAFNANHPMNLISTNAIFYNTNFGFSQKNILTRTELNIGNDVWLGHNCIIVPTVANIGNGAVIGAGSLVYKDVPAYSVVTGVPGRVVRKRFSQSIIDELQSSKWWEKSLAEHLENFGEFQTPLEGDTVR